MISFIWSNDISLEEKQNRIAVLSTSFNALFAVSFSVYFAIQDFDIFTCLILTPVLIMNFAPAWWRFVFKSHFRVAKILYLTFSFLAVYLVHFLMGPEGNVHLISLTLLIDAVLFLGFKHPKHFLIWLFATFFAFMLPLVELEFPQLQNLHFLSNDPRPFRFAIEMVVLISVMVKIIILAAMMESERLKQQKNYLAAQNNLNDKNNLLKILFHDIQLPLASSMNGFLNLRPFIQAAAPQAQQLANTVESSQYAIKEIIDNVSVLNSDLKSIEGQRRPHLLSDLLNISLLILRSRLEEKNIKLNYDPENLDHLVTVDRDSFVHQIMGNMMSNAVKFSPPDEIIYLDISIAKTNQIVLAIRNRGKFPEAVLARENFSSPGTWGEKGSGQGIKIAQRFCDLNKISLTLFNQDHFAVTQMEFSNVEKI